MSAIGSAEIGSDDVGQQMVDEFVERLSNPGTLMRCINPEFVVASA